VNNHFTFMERHVWANLGWVFCEVSFRCPEWLWYVLGHWTNTLGNWFYEMAYDRYERENGLEEKRQVAIQAGFGGGGTGPF